MKKVLMAILACGLLAGCDIDYGVPKATFKQVRVYSSPDGIADVMDFITEDGVRCISTAGSSSAISCDWTHTYEN
jgi:outer membrane biogenesis lipoprotein LolB